MRLLLSLITFLLMTVGSLSRESDPYLSPSSLCFNPSTREIFVAVGGAGKLLAFDRTAEKVCRELQLPRPVNGVVSSGEYLYITGGSDDGMLYKARTADLEVIDSMRLGHTPISPMILEGILYVCNRFSNTVSAINLADFTLTGEVGTVREPYSMAGTSAGLMVVNHLPAGPANVSYTGAVISVIDPALLSIEKEIPLPGGSTAVKDICVSADGEFAYVTHLLSRYLVPTTQLDRGWMVTNAVSIIDISTSSLLNTVLLDDVYQGAANPWGIVCSSDGKSLVVSHSGTHEISIIDLDTLHHNLDRIHSGEDYSFSNHADDVKNDLGFLSNCRTRIKLDGNGPREVLEAAGSLYIAEYFSGTLGIVDLAVSDKVRSISLSPSKDHPPNRLGEQYFHDATLSYQKWLSCSSCHPDGRNDAINWDLGNDGYGTLRQTKSLLLTHRTPPTTITGIRPNATVSVKSGFEHIEFTRVEDRIMQAIEAYLLNMKPETSPFLVDGKLSEQAQSGLEVFRKAKCHTCHNGPLYTDLGLHQVGNGYSPDEKFDTPTLLETWRTGPYLHDGRAADLGSMLVEYNPGNLHGETTNLSGSEMDDLVEYLLSISSMSPVITNPLQDITRQQGFTSETISLEGVFSDEDSESLSYKVDVEHPGIVDASISGSDLILSESGPGSTRVTVTAKDGAGGFADHQFTVHIIH